MKIWFPDGHHMMSQNVAASRETSTMCIFFIASNLIETLRAADSLF